MIMRAVALLVVTAAMSWSVQATVLVPAEFREIVNGSEIIAFGRVVETSAEVSDDRDRVETIVTLQVGTYLKGGPGETIAFKVPGGQVGRYRDLMIGAPIFHVGDEAVVFLNVRGAERPTVFGLHQGVYRIRVDERTKRRMVVPPPLMARGDSAEAVVRGAAARQPVSLETFGARVQSVLAEPSLRGAR